MTSLPITTIRDLVQELLRHRDAARYAEILAQYAVPSHDLEPYFRRNTRHYTRTCIQRNDEFELLVICYEPGQRTSIHDFNSQTAWVHPTRFAVDRPTRVPSGVPADVAWRAGGSPTWLRLRAWVPDPLPHRAAAHATRWPATDTTTTTASPTRTADQRRSWGGAVRSPPPLNRPVGWRPWPGTLDRSPTSTCPWAATLTRG